MSDQVANELFTAARRFQHRQFQKARHLNSELLSHAEWQLLVLLHHQDDELGAKPSDLARHQGVTAGNVTQQLRQLEKKQLIDRVQDQDDRRVVRIRLNNTGLTVLKNAKQSMLQLFSKITNGLGEKDTQELTRLLNLSAELLDSMEDSAC